MELDIGLFFAKSGIGYRVIIQATLYPIPDFAKKSPISNSILYSKVCCPAIMMEHFRGCEIIWSNIPHKNSAHSANANSPFLTVSTVLGEPFYNCCFTRSHTSSPNFFRGGIGPKWKSGRTKMKNGSENFSRASGAQKKGFPNFSPAAGFFRRGGTENR